MGLANTEVEGRFIFSGDSDQGPAFLWDATQVPTYGGSLGKCGDEAGDASTGVTFAVAQDGGQVFANADPSKNVLQSIETMRTALSFGGRRAAMTAALAPFSGHLEAVEYGALVLRDGTEPIERGNRHDGEAEAADGIGAIDFGGRRCDRVDRSIAAIEICAAGGAGGQKQSAEDEPV